MSARLFQSEDSGPSLKCDPARTRHGDQIAIPRWSGGVGGREAVGVVGVEEVGEIRDTLL